MQPFLCRKDDCANTTFPVFSLSNSARARTWAHTHVHTQRETNMQARLLLETRTAPALQQFKQLLRCFNFTRIWLRACKAQRQHLNCVFPCVPTSEQGWNYSWISQCLAKATCKAQISWGRLGFLPWLLAIHCADRLLTRARHCYHLAFMKVFFSFLHGQGTLLCFGHLELHDEFHLSQVLDFYGFWRILRFSPQQSPYCSTDKPCLRKEQPCSIPSPLPAPPPCPKQTALMSQKPFWTRKKGILATSVIFL